MKKRSISKVFVLLFLILTSFTFFTACGSSNVEFKINFMVNEEVYDTIKTSGNTTISMPENPTKNGYLFDGWYWDKDVWAEPFTANSLLDAPLSSDMSVYAKFIYDTTNLTEQYLIDALKDMPNVIDAEAVNEYNDPNDLLGRDGSYTICVYFSLDVIDQDQVYGNTLIDKGTDAGGCIEVFANGKDAETRNTYLTAFDGTIFASGSHKVFGTCVVRTANTLKASIQKIVENNLIKILSSDTNSFESIDTNLINLAKQYAEEELLSEYETATKLMELGYPYDKSEEIANICGVNWNNIAKLKAEHYVQQNTNIYPALISAMLNNHEFTTENISYAIANMSINWNAKAVIHANEYLALGENSYVSPLGMVVYLTWEKGYSVEVADYGVDNCNANWNLLATRYIEYIDSVEGILGPKADYITELVGKEFTQAQAEYAVANCGKNWNNHALICIEHFVEDLSSTTPNYSQCREKLESWGFSDSEIDYAINNYNGEIYPDKLDYVITLNVIYGSVSDSTIDVVYGQSYTLPTPTSSRDGYEFDGWYNGTTKYVNGTWKTASNVVLTARWKELTYTITYNLNGGRNSSSNPTSYTVLDSFFLMSPEKSGYNFIGWTYNGKTEPEWLPQIKAGTITGNLVCTAHWKVQTYTATLDANGGSVDVDSVEVTFDAPYTLPTPTRDGYEFDGWWFGGTKYTGTRWPTARSITLKAQWNIINYTISYNLNGGTNNSSNISTYTVENAVTIYNPTKTGYTFTGWTYDGQITPQLSVCIPKGSTGNKEFIANWKEDEFTITYVLNGGLNSQDNSNVYTRSDLPITLSDPIKSDAFFDGWFTSSNYSNSITQINEAENITIYAKWTSASKYLEYELNEDGTYCVSEYYSGVNKETQVRIPLLHNGKSITKIGEQAFVKANWIETIIISKNIIEIGESAFNGLDNLSRVIFEDNSNLISLDKGAFAYCEQLSYITFGNNSSLKNIGSSAFVSCFELSEIILPNSLETIESSAFSCSGLTTIKIPSSVTKIGSNAFQLCSSLTKITFEDPTGWVRVSMYGDQSQFDLSNPRENATFIVENYTFSWKKNINN